jgi:hypothetical protein
MPEKEGAEEKTTKSVVNKKQKQMMGEEGYDHLRDQGRIRKNKKKKDATSYPPSDEVKKTQKVNKGPSALERVKADIEKRYGKDAIMKINKEKTVSEEGKSLLSTPGLDKLKKIKDFKSNADRVFGRKSPDLTKVAESFGGQIVEEPVELDENPALLAIPAVKYGIPAAIAVGASGYDYFQKMRGKKGIFPSPQDYSNVAQLGKDKAKQVVSKIQNIFKSKKKEDGETKGEKVKPEVKPKPGVEPLEKPIRRRKPIDPNKNPNPKKTPPKETPKIDPSKTPKVDPPKRTPKRTPKKTPPKETPKIDPSKTPKVDPPKRTPKKTPPKETPKIDPSKTPRQPRKIPKKTPKETPKVDPKPEKTPKTEPSPQRVPKTEPGPQRVPKTEPGPQRVPKTEPSPQRVPKTEPGPQRVPKTETPSKTKTKNSFSKIKDIVVGRTRLGSNLRTGGLAGGISTGVTTALKNRRGFRLPRPRVPDGGHVGRRTAG